MSLGLSGLFKFSFQGVNATSGPQTVSVPGVKAGDIILSPQVNLLVSPLTSDDQIVQESGDYSTSAPIVVVIARFG